MRRAETEPGQGDFARKGLYSSKDRKAGRKFVTSVTVFPATYIRCLPFFYTSLVTSPLSEE